MKKASPDNNLVFHHPKALEHWDFERNEGLLPEKFLPKSQKSVFWKCKKGHSYSQRIANFTNGIGCPFCKNKKASSTNNLLHLHPELCEKWNFNKNTLTPGQVLPGSDRKVWWLCDKCGFEWEARVANITKRKKGCPKCHIQSVKLNNRNLSIKRSGSVLEMYPKLISSQWDYKKNETLDPSRFSIKSIKEVWWKCEKGHSWKTQIRYRTGINSSGCPMCNIQASKQELGLFYLLKKVFPDSVSQKTILNFKTDIYVPSKRIIIEFDGYPWHLDIYEKDEEKNHTFKVNDYTLLRVRDSRLAQLGGHEVQFESKDNLYTLANKVLPKLRAMKGITRKDKVIISEILNKNESFFDFISNKVNSEYRSIPENESVSFLFPNLLAEFDSYENDGLNLADFTKGSNKQINWKCTKCNQNWTATIAKRTKGLHGCPHCSKKSRGEKYQRNAAKKKGSFLETHPNLSSEWNFSKNVSLNPQLISAGSQIRAWWICAKGHEWQAIVKSRTSGTNCPFCAGKRRPATNKTYKQ